MENHSHRHARHPRLAIPMAAIIAGILSGCATGGEFKRYDIPDPPPFETLPGSDIEQWRNAVATYGSHWLAERDEALTGLNGAQRLYWVWEEGDGGGDRFRAHATTTEDADMLTINCRHIAGRGMRAEPSSIDQIATFLTDCAAGAGIDGLDAAALGDWVSDNLAQNWDPEGEDLEPIGLRYDIPEVDVWMTVKQNSADLTVSKGIDLSGGN
ncbi:hypothetical protein [Natronoglycomyces albus]|uniref:Lipoprotein n=1 Tax=Natronoglycomyces albus TaxID=2811108 RepID=A0A895XV44_9ACTN|nr:hypothetical protein [Natronoglycomyces albus]QSB06100.1 hypothetical protein JQS30_04055 [Natronoglycomyces albus]